MPSSSLRTLCHALGDALDDLGVYSVAASAASTVTVAALVNGTSAASATRYNGDWVYAPDTGSQTRRVATNGYNPGTGTLTVYPPWIVPPSVGDSIEITHLFPRLAQGAAGEDTDYYAIVNASLRRLAYTDRLSVPITTAQSYPLTAYSWLDHPDRLLGVYEPAATGSLLVPADWRGPRLVRRGQTSYLELSAPFAAASGSLELEVLRPAHTLVSGAESTTGLASDHETISLAVEDVMPTMLAVAYLVLMHRVPGRPDGGNWAAKYEAQLPLAMASKFYDRTSQAPIAPPQAQAAA